jgi:hypothetical protein
MSFWRNIANKLGRSLGLLGKPITIKNDDARFGSLPRYIAIQVESVETAEEEVLLFTENQIKIARERAKKNPEDVARFLSDHSLQDKVD